jgi:thymidylate kinase
MMMRKPRYIVFDGADGCGKTTQLEKLKEVLKNQGLTVYHTRALGGDGSCQFQQSIRKVLLSKKFPADQVDLTFEEKLFSMADNEGVRDAIAFLDQNKEGVVLKDRGLASHVVYSQARGMANESIGNIHGRLFNTEREISRHHGALHLVFVPSDVQFTMERIAARAKADGIEVVERLENPVFQKKVTEGMSAFFLSPFAAQFTVETITVTREDSIEAVGEKVMKVLKNYGYGTEASPATTEIPAYLLEAMKANSTAT